MTERERRVRQWEKRGRDRVRREGDSERREKRGRYRVKGERIVR